MTPPDDTTLLKAASGFLGAIVSLRFIVGSLAERCVMVLGGSALSFFASDPLADYLKAQSSIGLLGFLVGVFGMSLIQLVWEAVQAIDAKQISKDAVALVKKKWNA